MRLDALFQAPASFPTSAGRIFPQTISTWIDKRESIGVAKTCPPALNIMRLYQSKGDHSLTETENVSIKLHRHVQSRDSLPLGMATCMCLKGLSRVIVESFHRKILRIKPN
mgnify:CR=1 FL=1